MTPHDPPDDAIGPEESEAVEDLLRVVNLRRQVEEIAGEPLVGGAAPGLPIKTEEAFWQYVLDFESAPEMTLADWLRQRRGFSPPPPETLESEEELRRALWRLIGELAALRIFLHDTNHLADATLYRLLVGEVLEEPRPVMPPESGTNLHITISEYATPEYPDPERTYLAFYADDSTRAYWAGEFPEDEMPPKVALPFDRDRFLPKPGHGET